MSKRSTPLQLGRDGATQPGRPLAALDPTHVAVDERGHAELLGFVQAYAEQLRYFAAELRPGAQAGLVERGSWTAFARHPEISIADVVAYLAEPERFADDERQRWLARPHFALLLTFLELLGHAREQLRGLTARHLDHYYREILGMRPRPAEADHAAVLVRLAPEVEALRLSAGTALAAGHDSSGVERIYRTERELIVGRAEVAQLRSVHVHRRITEIPDVRSDRSLTARQAFDRSLELALGDPRPGDPVPDYAGALIDHNFVVGLAQLLEFSRTYLRLEQHELRALMKLVRRRAGADREWQELNRLMGVQSPADPRAFDTNLTSVVGVLDFETDGLPQVANLDDLYEHRGEPDVRAYIDDRLAAIGWDDFVAMMAIKRRIDADWAQINRTLEQIGRRQRGVLSWSLDPANPTSFTSNLANALGDGWPPPWPWATANIESYDAQLRALERHFAMPIERLERLVAFTVQLGESSEAGVFDWSAIDPILIDAHREKIYAARRARIDEARAGRNDLAGFDAAVAAALGHSDDPQTWAAARAMLEQYLDKGELDMLEHFRRQLVEPGAATLFEWADVLRVLELAQRWVERLPEPVARKVEWRNLYAFADATQVFGDPLAQRFKTFGQRPPAREDQPPPIELGWALRSPALALEQGTRTLTLTLGFEPHGFDRATVASGLGIDPIELDEAKLRAALALALVVEVSTQKGWIELPIDQARLAGGGPDDDYWSIRGLPRPIDEDRPALQLTLVADPTRDPLAVIENSEAAWPTLRVRLRQRWDEPAREWLTALEPFEALSLVALHLQVAVEGLVDVHVQHEDRQLDPRKPFAPFGHRPSVGARLYLGHPEQARARLDRLRLDITWMGLPSNLRTSYHNYPGISAATDFRARLSLVDRSLPLALIDAPLFAELDQAPHDTRASAAIEVTSLDAALHESNPGFVYARRSELALGPAEDLRRASRHFVLELTPRDFGHGIYAPLASSKSLEMSVALAGGQPVDHEAYRIDPPYTPQIQQLELAYQTSVELDPRRPGGEDELLHVHPFGVAPIDPEVPSLFPHYAAAGELYIGLSGLDLPRHLSLLVQLAEGTSNPDLEPAPIEWSLLDGDRWRALDQGELLLDSTRGLTNSGIVELTLPAVAASTRLPSDLHWLRVSVTHNPASVCDCVAIHAQAVRVRFDDQGNAADHYLQPLPVGSIDRLQDPDARVAEIRQPYTSYGGRPAEQPEHFHTRVSERLRHKQRALSPWDYERLVLQRFEGIYQAKCLAASAGEQPGRVDVIVVPDIRDALPSDTFAPRAPANLLADIETYLRERAPAAATVRVRNPRYVAVLVRLGVRFVPGIDDGFAKQRLNQDLIRLLSPWAFDGGHRADLMIGGRIYASSIIDFVDRCEYVDYVAEIKLFRSHDGENFDLLPPDPHDYHVATTAPDQILVAAHQHHIDVIPERGYEQASFTGLNYMMVGLDFTVG